MIKRDGTCTSIWQAEAAPYLAQNKPDQHGVYDVIIAGGGITSISAALLLQQAGRKCIVPEANNLCFGTTGGTTAHLNTLLDTPYTTINKKFGKEKAKLVARSVQEAIDLIRQNINTYQINCSFEETTAFLFAQDDKQEKELEKIKEATTEAGIHAKYTEQIPVLIPFTKAIQVEGQAKFIPIHYVYGLAKAFEEAGGVIVQQCRVTATEENETIEVETNCGPFTGNLLIYATHIPPTVNLLHLRCSPYRSYAMAVMLKNDTYPEGLIYDMYDPCHYYRTQEINGQQYLIGAMLLTQVAGNQPPNVKI